MYKFGLTANAILDETFEAFLGPQGVQGSIEGSGDIIVSLEGLGGHLY
jgi:hypothetical protein